MTVYTKADDLRKVPFRTVFIEVEPAVLAMVMGRRFLDPEGKAVSMESVSLRFDDDLDVMVAEPLIVKQEVRNAPLCTCGNCAYCRQ